MNSYDKILSALLNLMSRGEPVSIPSLMLGSELSYREVRDVVRQLASCGAVSFKEGSMELELNERYFGNDMSEERFDYLVKTLPPSHAPTLRIIARHDTTGFSGYGYKRITSKTAPELVKEKLIKKGTGGYNLSISFYTASRLLEVLDRIPANEVLAVVAHPFAVELIKSGRDVSDIMTMPVLPADAADYISDMLEKHEEGEEVLPIPERTMSEEDLKLQIMKSFIERYCAEHKREYEREMKKWVNEVEKMKEAPDVFVRCVKAAYNSLKNDLTIEEINEIKDAYFARLTGSDFDDDDDD